MRLAPRSRRTPARGGAGSCARPWRAKALGLAAVLFLSLAAAATAQEGAANDRILFGAWTEGGPWWSAQPYRDLEARLEHPLDIAHFYVDFSTFWPRHLIDRAAGDDRLPMISWEAYDQSLEQIVRGDFDDMIRSWARGAEAYGEPLYIRPFHEMNTNLFPWGMDPRGLIAAWRHIVDIFRSEGADNVLWVWAVNANDNPATAENQMEYYYPGADYVDVLAIDGYNWGTCQSWSSWQSFDQVFRDAYERVTLLGDQPVWVAEFGSTDEGGDKGRWIRDALAVASRSFPRIEALVYFDEDKAGHCDWTVDSSTESLQGFRDALDRLAPR